VFGLAIQYTKVGGRGMNDVCTKKFQIFKLKNVGSKTKKKYEDIETVEGDNNGN
jgi:hypothetical protein